MSDTCTYQFHRVSTLCQAVTISPLIAAGVGWRWQVETSSLINQCYNGLSILDLKHNTCRKSIEETCVQLPIICAVSGASRVLHARGPTDLSFPSQSDR